MVLMSLPSPEVRLKRLRAARDFWLSVPPSQVCMEGFGFRVLVERGLDNAGKCGAVGCLAGWLSTMPDVIEYRKHWIRYNERWCEDFSRLTMLDGYYDSDWCNGHGFQFFGAMVGPGRTPWQEGLHRLDVVIAATEDQVMGGV